MPLLAGNHCIRLY